MTNARTPTHAERCRTLLATARHATLCTLCRDPKGYPFGSLVAVAATPNGEPLLLLSTLAEHTQNLAAAGAASLLVTDQRAMTKAAVLRNETINSPSAEASATRGDPLAEGRLTFVGSCQPLVGEAAAEARVTFLSVHPEAAAYASFKDFAMFVLEPIALRYVGGFGRMSWVDLAAYKAAEPDPLRNHEADIVEHMNLDHADAVLACARVHGGLLESTRATMFAIDRYGFEVRAVTPEGDHSVRFAFAEDIPTTDAARRALVALTRAARAAMCGTNELQGPSRK